MVSMLKIKKCQWIGKPEKIHIKGARSLSFKCTDEHHFVWTTDEDECITFTPEGDEECGIAIIFSPGQGLKIANRDGEVTLTMDFQGVKTEEHWTVDEKKSLTVKRENDTVSFKAGEKHLYSLTFPSIAASVSISFWAKGSGEALFIFS